MKSIVSATVFIGILAAIAGSRLLPDPSAQAQQRPAPAAPANADPLPGTRLSVEQLKTQFYRVHAGKRLRPKVWPNGAKVAVALSFDLDNAAPALARGNLTLWTLSQGEYGGIDGLPRVLNLMDKHNIPATFFVPAVSDILQPTMIPSILAKNRHEIGAHGWIHEDLAQLPSEAEEKRLLDQSIQYLTKAIGKKPVGFRSPGATFSQHSVRLLKEAGFLYESTLMSSDDAYELNIDGKPSGLIELPIEWILDDAPYFTRQGTLPSPELIFEVYKDEFDVAYDEGGLFVLTMHPHIIGHRSRISRLDKLITYIKTKPGVWFATQEQIANYVKTAASSN
jgi:peptidoglycan/xylan/chitin deacetylase (PgdA/CDA1 family)